MQSPNWSLFHLIPNSVSAIAGQPVHTSAHQEMGAQLLRQTEQLVDVALPISDVHTASRIVQQLRGLSQVLQPANALFLFDRHTRRINPALQSIRAVELVSVPELDCCQAQWQAVAGGQKAVVHQNAATGVEPWTSVLGEACRDLLLNPDPPQVFMAVRELLRFVKNQNQKIAACGEPLSRRRKVASEDVRFADSIVAKETLGRLGVGPVLAGPRRSGAYLPRQLLQQLSRPLAVTHILKRPSHNLIVYPLNRLAILRRLRAFHATHLSSIPHGNHFAMLLQPNVST